MKYLTRYEVREIIKKCLSYGLTLDQIKKTVRVRELRKMEEKTMKYGWE